MSGVIIVISSDTCFLEMASMGLSEGNIRVCDFEDPLRAAAWIEKNPEQVVAVISHALIQNITLEEFVSRINSVKPALPFLFIDNMGVRALHEEKLKSLVSRDPLWLDGPVQLRQLTDFISSVCPKPEDLTDNIESISMF